MKAKSDFQVLLMVLLTRRGNNNNNEAQERGEASRAAGEKIDSGPSEMRPCTHCFTTAADGPWIREEK